MTGVLLRTVSNNVKGVPVWNDDYERWAAGALLTQSQAPQDYD